MGRTEPFAGLGDAVSRVISLLALPFSHQPSTEAKLRRICHTLTTIHSVVEEAKGHRIANDGVLQWLSELFDAEYQGRYLLDTIGHGEHELEDDDEQPNEVAQHPPQASSISSLFNPAKCVRVAASAVKSAVLSRRRDRGATEIDRVLESLQGVSRDLAELIMLLQGCRPVRRPLATNIFVDGQMFGRHVEKERIINFLLQDDELGVLPVVGDTGVGKTTLVQHACDDPRVRGRFAVIMVFVFSSCTRAVTTSSEAAIVLQAKHVIGDAGANLNDPLQLVKMNFRSKRFLLVFENVDTRRMRMLEELLPSLRCGGKKGSKVIFTTGSKRLTGVVGTAEPVVLKNLPSPEYWFFFKAHAFPGSDAEENPRLVAAGKAIAGKLNGSFFGAKIVGGLLRNRPDPKFWCKVLRSNIGDLSLLGDGIGHIADLAENLLPSYVEMCAVTVSKDRATSHVELAKFQDMCETHGSGNSLLEGVTCGRVLLCKSVLPFYNLHYIATCTIIDPANSCPELTVI